MVGGWDRPDVVTRLSALTLITNILLGIVLTIEFGPIGVVISTIVAEFFRYIGLLRFTSKRLSWSILFPRPLFEQFSAAVLMYSVITGFLEIINIVSVVHLLVVIGLGIVVYFGTLFTISRGHRQTVLSALNTT